MDSVEPPTAESIDGHAWGEYVRQARERWDVVTRSWGVFQRNSSELIGLLAAAETNVRYSLMLMTDLELIPGEQATFGRSSTSVSITHWRARQVWSIIPVD